MDEPLPRRKRRKVGTRSCQLCRQRKQRCELPDTEIEDSSNPLGPDKACHRCMVLQVDCIVDDRGKLKYAPGRRLKRKEANESPVGSCGPSPRAANGVSSEPAVAGPSRQEEHIDDGDLMRTFEPYHDHPESLARTTVQDSRHAGPSRIDRSQNGLKYHGRPQSITSVMIQMANRCSHSGVDLISTLSREVLQALEAAYPRLLIFHPYLPEWPEIVASGRNVDLGSRLRLYFVFYLLLPFLSPAVTSKVQLDRSMLASEITRLRNQVLRTLPSSEATLHSLLILAQLAPLGLLPLASIGDINDVGRDRSLHLACHYLLDGSQLDVDPQLLSRDLYRSSNTWVRLQHWSNMLSESLEEDTPRGTRSDIDASAWGKRLFNDTTLCQYAQDERLRDPILGPARTIGKLEILERAVRLEIVHMAVATIQNVRSDAAYEEKDLLQTISDRLAGAVKELEQVDERLSLIIAALNIDISEGLPETWMSYRNVCYQYHLGKLYRTAIRTYIATAFLPGLPCGTLCPGNAPGADPTLYVDDDPHALACDPQNVHLFFTAGPPPPARQYILPILVFRVEALGPLLQNLLSLEPTALIPWHQVICMAVDTCNVIMEVQAGTMAFGEVDKPGVSRNFRLQEWAQLKKMLGTISNNIKTADRWPVEADRAKTKGRTLGDVGAKLIGAMARVMEGRVLRFAKERSQSATTGSGGDTLQSQCVESLTVGQDGTAPGIPLDLSDPLLSALATVSPYADASANESPSDFSAAELDRMFAEIFNTTYPGLEFLDLQGGV